MKRGVVWLGLFRVLTRGVSLIRIAIIARLLTPTQFGLFGIASIILILLETFTETGINIFLIQEKKRLGEYVNSAWMVSIVRGIVITIILTILAPVISDFFNAKESTPLIMLIAIVPLIRGFINPSRVKYLKDLEFNKEVWFSGAVFIVDTTVTILLAYTLKSPTSLVWGLIAGAILETTLSLLLISPRPMFTFEKSRIKKIINRGKWVTGSGIFNYLFEQGDDIIVGKLLSTSTLGIYQVAYKISILPLTEVTKIINQITFPIYSNIFGDTLRLRKAFFKTFILTSLLVIIIGLLLFIYPRQIVRIILGEKWIDVVPILKILSVFGVIRAITISSNPLFNSARKQEYITLITLICLITMLVIIIPLTLKFGVLGTSISVLVGSLAALPLLYVYMKKIFTHE